MSDNILQEVLASIIGFPPRISEDYENGSLINAFINAVQVFEDDELPIFLKQRSYSALQDKVKASTQSSAKSCFDAFNQHYQDKLNSLSLTQEVSPPILDNLFVATEAAIIEYQKYKTSENLTQASGLIQQVLITAFIDESGEIQIALKELKSKYGGVMKNILQASAPHHRPSGMNRQP